MTTTYLTRAELDLCAEVRAMCACNQLRRATRAMTALALDHWEEMQMLVEERFGRERLRALYEGSKHSATRSRSETGRHRSASSAAILGRCPGWEPSSLPS
ncbi:MAG TPA: hypothetical protein VNA28_18120 [Solirubrobacteraceae bacterium]|nr:hypothetical protein [Solirubrobacteraceae bacterium]